MASIYNFKRIAPVPDANDFLDIVLSKTQRKTPTVIHPGYKITRIRQFYMRKVRFTQDTFDEKLRGILEGFPVLDNVHPFYADLMNVLYDKDHYKLALGQINTAKHLIDAVGKDYVRLLKFGDSLYRCKQLKRAAIGRMATIMKRQKDSLSYLEQVRQHLGRLPTIDPNTRTLIVCGYPNVGKSSFMNKVTRADVDVQPYAFTTKSLFVGHMDYKYLRWQVIDTPGILDHPLEDRNTIEMQSITALAHLRAAVMFFIDLSGQCGYSIQEQVSLFNSIKPLFANKPTLLVISKTDLCTLDNVSAEDRALIEAVQNEGGVVISQLSSYLDTGIIETRNLACDKLLQQRVEMKLKGQKVANVLNKLNVAQPGRRDTVERPAHIPDAVAKRRKYDPMDPDRRILERDLEEAGGGAGVYNINLNKMYMLGSDDWKYDVIPEIMDGKNVADFVDPAIDEKLAELEREEERLEAEGMYDSPDDGMEDDEEEKRIRDLARRIRAKKQLIAQDSRINNVNRPTLTTKQKAAASTSEEFAEHLRKLGLNSADAESTAARISKKRGRSESRDPAVMLARSSSVAARAVSVIRDRSTMGLRDAQQRLSANKKRVIAQRRLAHTGKAGEADRAIGTKMPKHLFSGKRGIGSTNRR
ncbi:Nucleolar GTP-binding protein 1 [Coemansia sp. RSA 2559]|nr:Nucleolar GTP-binding protein 1 [Coemansia sp. RSA 2559]KAJ2863962.1 Nucleolar GTP-binding protein 1 [Coemansia erecta]